MILAFDTSCDDTAVAVLKDNGNYVNLIASQIEVHKALGGVVPELAARKHAEVIAALTKEALHKAEAELSQIDFLSVTVGPGLLPSLLVGVSFAKALAYSHSVPLIAVHHIEGHIFAPFFKRELIFPFLSLVVSGGHTHLFLVKGVGEYEIIGKTLDDAVGEAFDKVARLLGLEYPGGPVIDRLSKTGDPYRFKIPQGLKHDKSYNFSFSGVKTYVKNLVNSMGNLSKSDISDIAASFQKASIDILVEKTFKAATEYGVKIVSISGGVSANSYLREAFAEAGKQKGIEVVLPPREMTTDNALMIAYRASFRPFEEATTEFSLIEAKPSIKVGSKLI
ncbi:tRNA (adenosine(37)-N6)-threonylcarbamoyltransferase complex transferase subunit TsaD [Hippea maritima]|uniref:tRNA N6-adenosine threonylcarbamoyltransferase n=1 Tax=Hippea maritima (strain ATCC 700847 / DSM 10411 / MH2) TaxID=760142 RepID=F2LWF5_HIPMA|nr:tRNA (adenosine(37)-N6)-threonylcarbamoyltransferase complex transferase subunit TsaD [Hippea maritima]AEA33001.1 O-sialoglycoprotein endopeptidase [Hippea maritima DSM 10411]